MVTVQEVKTKSQLKAFASFPVKLYKNCPYYVPSFRGDEISILDEKKNFSLKDCICKCFLAKKDGKIVGRIAGIISKVENEKSDKKYVRFSRFESIDDLEVFKALLTAVEEFGVENGASIIHGPWGFNDTDREGMLTYGFDVRSTYATNYSYPYFAENMEKLGYTAESKWIERRFIIPTEIDERTARVAKKVEERLNVKDLARTMTVKEILKHHADAFFETYNEAYGVLDGFVPIEGKQKAAILDQFATIINERYLSFIVDENGDVAAFGVVLPSIAKALIKHKGKLFPTGFISLLSSIKKPKELEMALIGVKPKYKNSGINAIVIVNIMKNVIEDKIELIESNPMLETNYSIQQQWKLLDNEVVKKRQTYSKDINK